jgi:hypothetical protein
MLRGLAAPIRGSTGDEMHKHKTTDTAQSTKDANSRGRTILLPSQKYARKASVRRRRPELLTDTQQGRHRSL